MTSATRSSFTDDIVRMYEGEFRGEALFSTIAEDTDDRGLAVSMELLARLERTMQGVISTWLSDRGIDHAGRIFDRDALVAHYGAMVNEPAEVFISPYRALVADACVRLAQWEKSAPADGAALARAITEHDDVILELIDLELAGNRGASRAPVEQFIARVTEPS